MQRAPLTFDERATPLEHTLDRLIVAIGVMMEEHQGSGLAFEGEASGFDIGRMPPANVACDLALVVCGIVHQNGYSVQKACEGTSPRYDGVGLAVVRQFVVRRVGHQRPVAVVESEHGGFTRMPRHMTVHHHAARAVRLAVLPLGYVETRRHASHMRKHRRREHGGRERLQRCGLTVSAADADTLPIGKERGEMGQPQYVIAVTMREEQVERPFVRGRDKMRPKGADAAPCIENNDLAVARTHFDARRVAPIPDGARARGWARSTCSPESNARARRNAC